MRFPKSLLILSLTAFTLSDAEAAGSREIIGAVLGEIGRQVERDQANRRHRHLERLWNACRDGALDACSRALATPGYTHEQRMLLAQQREELLDELQSLADRRLCLGASDIAACDRMLATGNLSPDDHKRILSESDAAVEDMHNVKPVEITDEGLAGIVVAEESPTAEQVPLTGPPSIDVDDTAVDAGEPVNITIKRGAGSTTCQLSSSRQEKQHLLEADGTYIARPPVGLTKFTVTCRYPDGTARSAESIVKVRKLEPKQVAQVAASVIDDATETSKTSATDAEATSSDTLTSLAQPLVDLPLSTKITGGFAAVLAMLLAGSLVQRTGPLPWLAGRGRPSPRQPDYRADRNAPGRMPAPVRGLPAPIAPRPLRAEVDRSSASAGLGVRDTDAALAALRLAMSFLAEAEASQEMAAEDESVRADTLNTLSLAARQLEIARQADPDAELVIEETSGEVHVLTQTRLRSTALFLEAMCYTTAKPKRALAILERAAAIAPDDPRIFFWIGVVNSDLLNKRRAIDALTRAVELDPHDIDYRKLLDRARNMSGAAIAVRKTADAASLARLILWSWWTVGAVCLLMQITMPYRIDVLTLAAAFYLIAFLGVRVIRFLFDWLT